METSSRLASALSDSDTVDFFNGQTGALISTLTGLSNEFGATAIVLTNGNFVIASHDSVTWGSSITGVSGVVSATNSLMAPAINSLVRQPTITPLANGNYVVDWVGWNDGEGAVTWGNGTTGTTGTVSAANSLVSSNFGGSYDVGGNGEEEEGSRPFPMAILSLTVRSGTMM